ncbi:MAG: hypothetical protein Q8P59_07380, partial [Dehalococcoidia bacterium]|nr:hypothetical protein [Dehalococcoidia bacterium]
MARERQQNTKETGVEKSRSRSTAKPRERHAPTSQKVDSLIGIIMMLASQVELDDLLSLLATKTSEVMNAERSTIYLIDDTRQDLWSKVAQGLGSLEIRLKIGQGLAGQAWKTGRSII